jgi:glycosyltransferase involved in cell wall biosynthesis
MNINFFFKKVIAKSEDFLCKSKNFGFPVAFWNLLYGFKDKMPFALAKSIILKQKHNSVVGFLASKYSGVIDDFPANIEFDTEENDAIPKIIWICWWDGVEEMPEIVKICYNSVVKHAGEYKVILINKNNFNDFVSISDHITHKLNSGIITLAHFTDILRMYLLFKHGGLWLDATIFVSNTIDINMPFFTIKRAEKNEHVYMGRWSTYCFGGRKQNIFSGFMIKFYDEYYKKENVLIDYFLFDYIISIAYNYFPQIKKMFDAIPCNNNDVHKIQRGFNEEYTEEYMNKILAHTTFHKLSWKDRYNMYTTDNKLTIYGHLKKTVQTNKFPLFSLLVANYNNTIFIRDCIKSVIAQTYKNWEMIIVDDGSTDNSIKIIIEYAEKDARIKLFTNDINYGCGYTKNRCAVFATGEICGFLDPDDALLPDALDIMINEHLNNPDAAIISSRHFHCDEKMKAYDVSIDGTKAHFISELETPWIINHFVSFKKKFYDQTEGIDPFMKRSVDTDLYLKLEEKGKVIFIDKVLYLYRHNKNSISLYDNSYKAQAWHLYANSGACKRRNISFDDHCNIIKPSLIKKRIKYIVFFYKRIVEFFKQRIRLYGYYRVIRKPGLQTASAGK